MNDATTQQGEPLAQNAGDADTMFDATGIKAIQMRVYEQHRILLGEKMEFDRPMALDMWLEMRRLLRSFKDPWQLCRLFAARLIQKHLKEDSKPKTGSGLL